MPTEPNGRMLNWSNVRFTPFGAGALPIPILGVKDVQIDPRATIIGSSADASAGPETKHLTQTDPMATVEVETLSVLHTLPSGTRGTFEATHRDADNGEGTGAMQYTLTPAIIANTPRGGRHQQYGTGRLMIETYRPDGETNPLRIAIVPPV